MYFIVMVFELYRFYSICSKLILFGS